jgi:hypothetical protein
MDILNFLWILGIFYDHLVHFVIIWYIFSGFCIMFHEKSGNPAPKQERTGKTLWRRGTTVIATASESEYRGFESHQGAEVVLGLSNCVV